MGIAVLGPLSVEGVESLGLRDRIVLEALVVRGDEVVDKGALADALWGDQPPASWRKIVQGCIARLRKLLPPGTIRTTPYGYRLNVHVDQLDALRFEQLLARSREHLLDHDPDHASYVLDEALQLWRGPALPDVVDWEAGRIAAERLEGLRLDAEELKLEAELSAGRPRTVLEYGRTLVKEAPFREARWALLAKALYQSGRQTEALEVLQRARSMLREELGLDPGPRLLELEQAILRQDPSLAGAGALQTSPVCPYRGLLAYDAEDADSFFGREVEVAACLDKLRTKGVLVVVGPSGIGKSSLVRAGVVASLQRDGRPVFVCTPGTRPLDALASLPERGTRPVLVVDQAEEVVTLCSDPGERAAFLRRLDEYDGPLVVVLRADRLGDLSAHAGFAHLVERGLHLLGPMGADALRSAIEGPARHAGLRLQPGLVDLLVREVEGEPGALPLLSHVLRQTWELREGPTLTVEGYRATGGIRDAVAQSAEHLYEQLDDPQRDQLRALFLRLVLASDEGEPVRARVPRKKLAPDEVRDRLVERLVDARLVSSDDGDVQIAHEALAREWPRLRGWLEEDVEGQRIFRHLVGAAEAWEAMGRPDSELYRGVRLAGAVDWAGRSNVQLTDTERTYLDASRTNADRELRAKTRSNRRLRLSLVGTAVMLVAALVAGSLALDSADRSRRAADVAADAARIADSRRLSAQALVTVEPDLAVLLAVQAVRLDDSTAARSSLYEVLEKNSRLVAVARGTGFDFVEVSPDGQSVAVSSAFGAPPQGLTIYDAHTLAHTGGREDLRELAVEYSPDSRSLAVGISGWDPSGGELRPVREPLQVLDAETLRTVGSYGGFAKNTYVDWDGLAFSADGSRVAAVAWKDHHPVETLVWNTDHPARPVLRVPMPGIYGQLGFSPDGDVLYVAQRSGPRSLRAIDVDTGAVLRARTPNWGGERAGILAISENGTTLARSGVDGVVVMDSATFRERFTLAAQPEGVSALAFTRDNRLLAAGYADGTTIVWDVARRRPLHTFRGHSQEVRDLAFSPDARTLYTVSPDRLLLAWDLAGTRGFPPWKSFRDRPQGTEVFTAVPSPDGTKVAYAAYGGGLGTNQIQIRDLATGELTELQSLPQVSPPPPMVLWSPDSQMLLTGGGYTKDPSRGVRKTTWLQTWEPESGALIEERAETGVDEAAFTQDGEKLVVLRSGRLVTTIDPLTLEQAGSPIELPGADGTTWWPARLGPDDRTLVLVREGRSSAVVLDLETRSATQVSLDGYPFSVAFSPDGTKLAVFYDVGTWGVVDVPSLRAGKLEYVEPVRAFSSNLAWDAVWSDDGTTIITVSSGVVELWDAATLDHLGSLSAGSKDDIVTARPLPDGHTVMLAHPQGDVLTWDLQPEHLLDTACDLAGRNLTRDEWSAHLENSPYRATCPGAGMAPR